MSDSDLVKLGSVALIGYGAQTAVPGLFEKIWFNEPVSPFPAPLSAIHKRGQLSKSVTTTYSDAAYNLLHDRITKRVFQLNIYLPVSLGMEHSDLHLLATTTRKRSKSWDRHSLQLVLSMYFSSRSKS